MSVLVSATRVLRCFDVSRPELGVTEVAELLGVPKSSISRLLRAMRDVGLLESVAQSRRYRPGVLLMEVGQLTRMHSSLLAAADELTRSLVRRFGHSGYVSALDGQDVTGLSHHQGGKLVRVGAAAGDRLPAAAAATGRALLARRSDDAVRALYQSGFAAVSSRAPQSLPALLDVLAAIRRDGIAWACNETEAGVESIAGAVGNPATGEALALCIVYPLGAATETERDEMENAMRQGVLDIARAFGDVRTPARPLASRQTFSADVQGARP